jgi:superkiller protein 3
VGPRRKRDLLDQAREFYLQGHNQEALEAYLEALVRDPDNPDVHCGLGEVFEALGRLGDALVAFEQALRLNPNHAWAHFGKGGVFQSLRRYREAAASYRRAAELQPTEAVLAYQRASAADPEDPWPLLRLAGLLSRYGHPRASEYLCQAAARVREDDPWEQAVLSMLSGRPEEALEYVRQAVVRLPESADWLSRDPDLEPLQADERFWLILSTTRRR